MEKPRTLKQLLWVMTNPIVKDGGKPAEIGEHRFWHNGEHVKVSETEWAYVPDRFSIIHDWLDFNEKTDCVVYQNGHYETVKIPIVLLQDPRSQTINQKDYQIITKNFNQKLDYLKKFDFYHASEEKISDAVRLMGLVNACAFKGKRRLTEEELNRNKKIYTGVKTAFINRLVDFCISEENNLLSFDDVERTLYVENPYTRVQISFHCNPEKSEFLQKATDTTWNHSLHSFVYECPEQMDYYEKLLQSINRDVLDSLRYVLYNNGKGLNIMDKKSESENNDKGHEYIYRWGNGECDSIWAKTEEEVIEFWKSKAGYQMPIIDIYCPDTDKYLKNPNL
ncbi:MAG: hypothetical protein J5710_08290 [Treponema sp.]|nr:hypothetical protein [Treponema sp.]